jgi:transcriptional regulator with XRE-family HTH domain
MQNIVWVVTYDHIRCGSGWKTREECDWPARKFKESRHRRHNGSMRGVYRAQLTLDRVLKEQRKKIGLSQQVLARKLGIKAGQVAQLEGDSGARPSFQLLSRIASILGLEKDRLFHLAESTPRASSGARTSASGTSNNDRLWRAFAHNRALLDRHYVRPQELKALRGQLDG